METERKALAAAERKLRRFETDWVNCGNPLSPGAEDFWLALKATVKSAKTALATADAAARAVRFAPRLVKRTAR